MKKSSIAILAALVVAGILVAYSIAVYGGRVIEAGDGLLTDIGDYIGDYIDDQAGDSGGEATPAEPQVAQADNSGGEAGDDQAGDDQAGDDQAGDSSGGDDEPTAAQPPQAPAAEPTTSHQPSGRVPVDTRYRIQGIASDYLPGQATVREESDGVVEISGNATFRPAQPAVAPMAAPAGSIPVTELGPGICSAVVDRRAEQTVITVGGS
ncbi:MAG: hypothetical protein ABIJ46_00055, partial [bacterium]